MKKYEFTGEVKVKFGVTLKRIRALIDFGNVKKRRIRRIHRKRRKFIIRRRRMGLRQRKGLRQRRGLRQRMGLRRRRLYGNWTDWFTFWIYNIFQKQKQ